MDNGVEVEVAHGKSIRQTTKPTVLKGPAAGEIAASETSKSSL